MEYTAYEYENLTQPVTEHQAGHGVSGIISTQRQEGSAGESFYLQRIKPIKIKVHFDVVEEHIQDEAEEAQCKERSGHAHEA